MPHRRRTPPADRYAPPRQCRAGIGIPCPRCLKLAVCSAWPRPPGTGWRRCAARSWHARPASVPANRRRCSSSMTPSSW
ncbi:MAG: hypothetical protein MZV70_39855 [Desulfobacterales bacterium]|nr:hypothetical protein [Desulfobacterales bacterium]